MAEPIRVDTPDAASAADLMQEVVSRFRAELVSGANGRWEVHFHQDREQSRLVLDVLSVVERWLEARELTSTTLHLNGHSYTLRNAARPPQRAVGP